jgi:tRNA(Ile)-lysidine synthase
MNAFTLDRFAAVLEATLQPLPAATRPPRVCVALSGGLDSSVLLVALADLQRAGAWSGGSVRALHVDHSLHAESAGWAEASRALAESLGIAYRQVRVDARAAPGESPEAAARAARYSTFREQLAPDEVLLTAHHADDQLETVWLQWLRGGGLRAVAGMAPFGSLGSHAWHARPLLGFERRTLEQFARGRGLRWIEDPANADLRFDRNYLRHVVLPTVYARWPAAARTVGRVAGFAREALELEGSLIEQDINSVLRGRAVLVAALHELAQARQRAVLRAWLGGLALPMPTSRTLLALQRDVALAAADRNPETRWRGAVVRRYRGCLHADVEQIPRFGDGDWQDATGGQRYVADATMGLELTPDRGKGLSQARLPSRLRVVSRRGGEDFRPAHGTHRRPLRKWLQEHGVLPWRRQDLPLVVDEHGGLVAIADLGCAAGFAAEPGEPSWRVTWRGRGVVTESDAFGFKWPGRPSIG